MVAVVVLAMFVGAWCGGVAAAYGGLLQQALQHPNDHHDLGTLFVDALGSACRQPLSAFRGMLRGTVVCAALYGVLAGVLFHVYALGPVFMAYCAAAALLLMLAIVDAKTCLLPDALVYPLLWLGLVLAWWGGPVSLHSAVAAVVLGYLFLWLLAAAFRLMRGCHGMGHGDFKLLAALGAWVGVGSLPYVLLAACLSGILFACVLQVAVQRRVVPAGAYPFGPFLALASVVAMVLQATMPLYFNG